MVHSRRDVLLSLGAAVFVEGALRLWGDAAVPYMWAFAGLCFLVVGWDVARPRWVHWRDRNKAPGYVKIKGGYRTANSLHLRYADGHEEHTVTPETAKVIVTAHDPTIQVSYPSRWQAWRQWLAQRPGKR